MSKQAAIDAVKSTLRMDKVQLEELGRKVSLSAFPDNVQKIIFRAIEKRHVELSKQDELEGAMVVSSEIKLDTE